MSSTETLYTARFLQPELIEHGLVNALECPVYRDGSLVSPTEAGSTVSIYSRDSTIVDAAAVTVTGSKATYSLPAATVADEDLAEGWRIEWSLVISGSTFIFRNDAALVRRRLFPVISAVDLYRRHPDLDPSNSASLVSAGEDHQDALDEAWAELQLALIAQGNRPNLIMSPSSLRLAHLFATLEIVARNFATTSGDGKWEALAATYGEKRAAEMKGLSFIYDADDDGEADDPRVRRAAVGSIWTNGRF